MFSSSLVSSDCSSSVSCQFKTPLRVASFALPSGDAGSTMSTVSTGAIGVVSLACAPSTSTSLSTGASADLVSLAFVTESSIWEISAVKSG